MLAEGRTVAVHEFTNSGLFRLHGVLTDVVIYLTRIALEMLLGLSAYPNISYTHTINYSARIDHICHRELLKVKAIEAVRKFVRKNCNVIRVRETPFFALVPFDT
jgi:hypothetical protein